MLVEFGGGKGRLESALRGPITFNNWQRITQVDEVVHRPFGIFFHEVVDHAQSQPSAQSIRSSLADAVTASKRFRIEPSSKIHVVGIALCVLRL